jgi:hypothetical protein
MRAVMVNITPAAAKKRETIAVVAVVVLLAHAIVVAFRLLNGHEGKAGLAVRASPVAGEALTAAGRRLPSTPMAARIPTQRPCSVLPTCLIALPPTACASVRECCGVVAHAGTPPSTTRRRRPTAEEEHTETGRPTTRHPRHPATPRQTLDCLG